MLATNLAEPLVFEPIFMERIWGGRQLERLYGKRLPAGAAIGESWELADRPEVQSVVHLGPWRGRTLHDLWQNERLQVFGKTADAERFPILIKLLDAAEKLSLQVHPPPDVAAENGGEPKTEFWYVADAQPAAELFVGLKRDSSRQSFQQALDTGSIEEHVHRLSVKTGDAMFLPSGRVHAIGAGNVIVEIQQNSDTTYRVFDWNRTDSDGASRALHIKESLSAIRFDDYEPSLITPAGESLVQDLLFNIDKWELPSSRSAGEEGVFAIVCCLQGAVRNSTTTINPGEFFLVPAAAKDRVLHPAERDTALLRVTVPA